jgi:hypothetical protein
MTTLCATKNVAGADTARKEYRFETVAKYAVDIEMFEFFKRPESLVYLL